MARCNNWPKKLAEWWAQKQAAPFVWGVNDCCLAACDWLAACVGEDPARVLKLRGKYRTAVGAAKVLKARGGVRGIAEAWCKRKGWGEVPVLCAQRGDLALVAMPEGEALGVVGGALVGVPGKDGLATVPAGEALTAWAVERGVS
jgi:hypothetical protein